MKWIIFLLLLTLPASAQQSTLGGGSSTRTAVRWVSPSGSDSSSIAGNSNAPFLSPSNALAKLNGSGTIVVRGGNYFNQTIDLDNATDIKILSYPGETPNFYYGEVITSNSWTAVSNGIFSATLPAGFAANLSYLSNTWASWPTRGVLLYQTNKPYGTNDISSDYMPMNTGIFQRTNRCEHTPLLNTNSLSAITNKNGFYVVQGSTIYVKFAVSNVAGGIYIPATNVTDTFVKGGNPATSVKIRGIKSHFGWTGFDLTDVAEADLTQCAGIGCGRSGIWADILVRGDIKLYHCEGYLNQLAGCEFGSANDTANNMPASVISVGGFWHDNNEEASPIRGGVVRTEVASMAHSGGLGLWGFINDGGVSRYVACTTYSNLTAGFQVGNSANFLPTYDRIMASSMNLDKQGYQVNDMNVGSVVQGSFIDSYLVPINVAANPTTHFVQSLGTVIVGGVAAGNLNGEIIQGAGTTDQTKYPVSTWGLGASYGTLVANAFRMPSGGNAPLFGGASFAAFGGSGAGIYNSGGANFSLGVVTNMAMVWHATNATPSLAYSNGSIATVSDGRFYVRTNDTWVQK